MCVLSVIVWLNLISIPGISQLSHTHTFTHFLLSYLNIYLPLCNLLFSKSLIPALECVRACACVQTGPCKMSQTAGTKCPYSSSQRRTHPSRRKGGRAISEQAPCPSWFSNFTNRAMIYLCEGSYLFIILSDQIWVNLNSLSKINSASLCTWMMPFNSMAFDFSTQSGHNISEILKESCDVTFYITGLIERTYFVILFPDWWCFCYTITREKR